MVGSLLKMAGLDWPVPDTSTLCRRQKTVTIQIPYRRSGAPLNLPKRFARDPTHTNRFSSLF